MEIVNCYQTVGKFRLKWSFIKSIFYRSIYALKYYNALLVLDILGKCRYIFVGGLAKSRIYKYSYLMKNWRIKLNIKSLHFSCKWASNRNKSRHVWTAPLWEQSCWLTLAKFWLQEFLKKLKRIGFVSRGSLLRIKYFCISAPTQTLGTKDPFT